MARIRSVTHLKTWEELEEFGKWCKGFECRAVKGNLHFLRSLTMKLNKAQIGG